jgi:hypothetical protein
VIDGIGVAPLVVAALVATGVALAALIYYAFKPDYDQSKIDLNISKNDNDKIKAVLGPEGFQKFSDKLKGQVADAYKAGDVAGKSSATFSIMTPLLLAGAAFIFLPRLIDSASRKAA